MKLKENFAEFKRFFKEFKWDKEHVKPLVKILAEIVFFAFIVTLDLTMKEFLFDFLDQRGLVTTIYEDGTGRVEVLKNFLAITYTPNTGMGFGLFKDGTLTLTVMTFIVLFAAVVYLVMAPRAKAYIRVPLVMIVAGGIGNLVDRIAYGLVRDFFEFTFVDFAIFNVADAFVTVGAIVLILGLIVTMFAESKGEFKSEAAEEKAEDGQGDTDGGKTSFTVESAEKDAVGGRAPAEGNNGRKSLDGDGGRARAAFAVERPKEADDGADTGFGRQGQTDINEPEITDSDTEPSDRTRGKFSVGTDDGAAKDGGEDGQ